MINFLFHMNSLNRSTEMEIQHHRFTRIHSNYSFVHLNIHFNIGNFQLLNISIQVINRTLYPYIRLHHNQFP